MGGQRVEKANVGYFKNKQILAVKGRKERSVSRG